MVLMIAMMQHTCLAEITLDNTKEWDAENQTITIFNESSKTKLMTVKLISARPDLCTFTEIYKVRNLEVYTPDSKADFKARTNMVVGSGAVTNVEWFIEQNESYVVNVTDYGIKQVEEEVYNNKTGTNKTVLVDEIVIIGYHDEIRYKYIWVDYQPYAKEMKKDYVQKIKIVYYKVPELGPFQIQTVPMFRGVECPELTWWSGSWDRRRAILINNTVGDAVTDSQLMSENISSFNIDASSSRIVNETSGLQESFWNETVDASGNLEYVWCNFSNLPSGSWINSTYYIYYQSVPAASSVSDGGTTFLQFSHFDNDLSDFGTVGTPVIVGSDVVLNDVDKLYPLSSNRFGYGYMIETYAKADEQDISFVGWFEDATIDNKLFLFNSDAAYPDDFDRFGTQSMKAGTANAVYVDNLIDFRTDYVVYGITRQNGNATYYQNRTLMRSETGSAYLPIVDMGFGVYVWNSTQESTLNIDWMFIRKYTTNEPEPWTVGPEEEYSAPTPTPTPTSTPAPLISVSPVQYDELDLPLILYIVMISMLYLLIVFRHGVAAVELSLIYLIFAFFFLLFQTITISVNYIYITLFLLLFLISRAGITKQGAD
jgi:hypothetical protein